MFTFVDRKLKLMKHVHNTFLGNLDVIIKDYFYQVPPICDSWVFPRINYNGFDKLWSQTFDKGKNCYEPWQVLWQLDKKSIQNLNKFHQSNINNKLILCIKHV
jgi:hypothetical protein